MVELNPIEQMIADWPTWVRLAPALAGGITLCLGLAWEWLRGGPQ